MRVNLVVNLDVNLNVNLNVDFNVNLNVNLNLLCLLKLFFKKESIKISPTDASPYAYI